MHSFYAALTNCERKEVAVVIGLVRITCYRITVSRNCNAIRTYEHVISDYVEAIMSNGEVRFTFLMYVVFEHIATGFD